MLLAAQSLQHGRRGCRYVGHARLATAQPIAVRAGANMADTAL